MACGYWKVSLIGGEFRLAQVVELVRRFRFDENGIAYLALQNGG